jgi:hypothetical protein
MKRLVHILCRLAVSGAMPLEKPRHAKILRAGCRAVHTARLAAAFA